MTRSVCLSPLVLALAACGGGGANPLFVPEVPFTTFAAVQPQTTVVMGDATSTTTTGTYTGTSGSLQMNLPTNAPAASTGTGNTLKLTYDRNRVLSGVSFVTPGAQASFSLGNTTTFSCASGVCSASNPAVGDAVVIDGTTTPLGWNYQTYGVWNRLASSSVFQAGAVSAGVVTPASAVPTSGTATFTGRADAFFTDASGTPFLTSSSMTAGVDWGTKLITFSTSATLATNLNSRLQAANPALNLTGTLTYDTTLNRFTGTVATTGVMMNGTATGRFYGPSAQEIGGTFGVQGAGGTMVGGFGGKR